MTNRHYSTDDILSAHFCPPPSFAKHGAAPSARKGRKAEGLRYEAKVQAMLTEKSDLYLPGPWLLYVVAGRPQWCQPDGLHLDYKRGVITVIEVKLTHTADAARQLRGVYEPVIRRLFPRPMWGVKLVEVTRWFDPDIKFPETTTLCADPFAYTGTNIGVHIWRP